MTVTYGIALGSNVGDSRANLERGVDLLLQCLPGARVVAGACLYETDPVDCALGTQAFLNTVVELESALPPPEVHAALVAVEHLLGRAAVTERGHHAPRPLDLDMLYAGDYRSDDPVLTVPHPRLHLRRFVLQPLAEIRPALRLPSLPLTVAEYLAALTDEPATVRPAGGWKYAIPV